MASEEEGLLWTFLVDTPQKRIDQFAEKFRIVGERIINYLGKTIENVLLVVSKWTILERS